MYNNQQQMDNKSNNWSLSLNPQVVYVFINFFYLFINTRQKDQEASNTVGKSTT